VEVLTPEGWRRYDPTAGEYYMARESPGLFRRISELLDFLQYTWVTSVVTYSNQSRAGLWQQMESGITDSVGTGRGLVESLRNFLRSDQAYLLSSRLIVLAIAASILAAVAAIGAFLWEKHRLYRRAERIGLAALPSDQQLRLARQLAFYDELLTLLARRRIHRPRSMTHMEFARSLSFLPAETYDLIRELTDTFYGIRYGERYLDTQQRRQLSASIAEIAQSLSGGMRIRAMAGDDAAAPATATTSS